MIVKLGYSDIQGYGVQATIGEKKVKLYMYVQVTEFDIAEALEALKGNKFVVAMEYVGNVNVLSGLNFHSLPVIVKHEIDEIDESVDEYMSYIQNINTAISVMFKFSGKYSNMKKVLEYSEKYKNIGFCGGYMLRIPGAKLGCVKIESLTMGKQGSKSNLICDGCACVLESKGLDEYTDIIFLSKEDCIKGTVTKTSRQSNLGVKKEKKVVSSLFELDKEMEGF